MSNKIEYISYEELLNVYAKTIANSGGDFLEYGMTVEYSRYCNSFKTMSTIRISLTNSHILFMAFAMDITFWMGTKEYLLLLEFTS